MTLYTEDSPGKVAGNKGEYRSGVSWGHPHRGHSSRTAKAKESAGQGFLGLSTPKLTLK